MLTVTPSDETEKTTTLSAILWKRAQNEPGLLQGYFEQVVAGGKHERIGHHEQVEQVRATGSVRTLYLVIQSVSVVYR